VFLPKKSVNPSLAFIVLDLNLLLSSDTRPESDRVREASYGHHSTPPDSWMQVEENWRMGRRVRQLPDTLGSNDDAIGEEEDAREKPDGH
jgi:hypothetical protein